MNLKWHGRSCFSLKTKTGTFIFDPHTIEAKEKKYEEDIVISTDDKKIKGIKENKNLLNWPGEYEINDASFRIIDHDGHHIVIMEYNGLLICHLGALSSFLPEEIVSEIGGIDVLFVPIGDGEKMLDFKEAVKVIDTIEPKVVIPMNYQIEGDYPELATSEAFLKEMGKVEIESETSYSFKNIPYDRMETVVLEKVKM